jgi:hypothetical protein
VAEELTTVPTEALATPGARELAAGEEGLVRLVEQLGEPAREALVTLARRLDTPAGRRSVEALAWLLRLVAGLPPELIEALERGVRQAAGALGDPTTPKPGELLRLARRPELRRGVRVLLELLAGLGGAGL